MRNIHLAQLLITNFDNRKRIIIQLKFYAVQFRVWSDWTEDSIALFLVQFREKSEMVLQIGTVVDRELSD